MSTGEPRRGGLPRRRTRVHRDRRSSMLEEVLDKEVDEALRDYYELERTYAELDRKFSRAFVELARRQTDEMLGAD